MAHSSVPSATAGTTASHSGGPQTSLSSSGRLDSIERHLEESIPSDFFLSQGEGQAPDSGEKFRTLKYVISVLASQKEPGNSDNGGGSVQQQQQSIQRNDFKYNDAYADLLRIQRTVQQSIKEVVEENYDNLVAGVDAAARIRKTVDSALKRLPKLKESLKTLENCVNAVEAEEGNCGGSRGGGNVSSNSSSSSSSSSNALLELYQRREESRKIVEILRDIEYCRSSVLRIRTLLIGGNLYEGCVILSGVLAKIFGEDLAGVGGLGGGGGVRDGVMEVKGWGVEGAVSGIEGLCWLGGEEGWGNGCMDGVNWRDCTRLVFRHDGAVDGVDPLAASANGGIDNQLVGNGLGWMEEALSAIRDRKTEGEGRRGGRRGKREARIVGGKGVVGRYVNAKMIASGCSVEAERRNLIGVGGASISAVGTNGCVEIDNSTSTGTNTGTNTGNRVSIPLLYSSIAYHSPFHGLSTLIHSLHLLSSLPDLYPSLSPHISSQVRLLSASARTHFAHVLRRKIQNNGGQRKRNNNRREVKEYLTMLLNASSEVFMRVGWVVQIGVEVEHGGGSGGGDGGDTDGSVLSERPRSRTNKVRKRESRPPPRRDSRESKALTLTLSCRLSLSLSLGAGHQDAEGRED